MCMCVIYRLTGIHVYLCSEADLFVSVCSKADLYIFVCGD